MPTKTSLQREPVAFSPREFAALFNKEQSWGYRQIYAGKVKAITEYGRTMIPASEVEKILGTASRYEGFKKKPAKTKAEIQALKPQLKEAWRNFIRQRRNSAGPESEQRRSFPKSAVQDPEVRRTALERLAGKRKVKDSR